jgi:hypothetical protein
MDEFIDVILAEFTDSKQFRPFFGSRHYSARVDAVAQHLNLIFEETEPSIVPRLHPLRNERKKWKNEMIHRDLYHSGKNSKRPANTAQKHPAIFMSPLNYNEISGSGARTENLADTPFLIAFSASLLMDLISLFLKNISLLSDFKFPVNFDDQTAQACESPVRTGLFVYTLG